MSARFSSWADSQIGISPLAKLLLVRLADAHVGCDGIVRWDPEFIADFCCVTPAEIGIAFGDLVDRGLVRLREGRFVLACGVE